MMNFDNRKWRKIALNETIYIFKNKKEMENFKNVKDMIPNSQDLFEFIFEYIKFILGFYKNTKLKNKIFIFLDEYDESENSKIYILNMIEYIQINRDKLFLCISGETEYIYKEYYNYLIDNNQSFNAIYWDLNMKKDEKDKEDNLLSLPLYYYRYKINRNLNLPSFKNKIKNEIKIQFKKTNLDKFLLVSKYLSTFINIKDLKHKFEYFPLELLSIEIKKVEENILIKFNLNWIYIKMYFLKK